jgi:charged multivesicular body protein 1
MGNDHKKQVPKQSASDQMFDMLFEFKMMAKNLQKQSVKAVQEEKFSVMKVKEAIERNNIETAKIHATDAIRKKNESRRLLILSSKIDAVHSRLQNAYQTSKLTEGMQTLTRQMNSALGSMDLVQVNETMKGFENMFDNLDVNAEFMDRVMDNVNAGTADESGVKDLIGQVATEFNIKLESEFSDVSIKNKQQEKVQPKEMNQNLKT